MILKNKLTKESLVLTRSEFYTKFANEIQTALDSYIKTENAKLYFKATKTPETDFYFDLQWNFNHFGMSNWYIKRI